MKPIEYTVISEESFNQLFENNTPFFLKGIKPAYLNSDYATIETRDFIRPSSTVEQTYHFFDLSMNHCNSWKNLPKRSKSLIGTTSLELAKTYNNNIYVCFLIDGDAYKCPSHDIQYSFDYGIGKELKNKNFSTLLYQYNLEILEIMKSLNWTEEQIRNCDYDGLLSFFKSNDFKNIEKKGKLMERLCLDNLVESNISKLFNPIDNNFEKIKENPSLRLQGLGNEVFGSGKFILINYEIALQRGIIQIS